MEILVLNSGILILFPIIIGFHIPYSLNYYVIRISSNYSQAIYSFIQSLDWADKA